MKTKEELNALKEEIETLNKKLAELTDEEMEQVAGGGVPRIENSDGTYQYGIVMTHRLPDESVFSNTPKLPDGFTELDLAGRRTDILP